MSLEREADLERAKAQLDLDWQRRYDDVERQQYERSEDLVKGLTQSRNEVSWQSYLGGGVRVLSVRLTDAAAYVQMCS